MAKSLGRLGTVEISTNGGANYTPIGRLIDPTVSLESAEVNVTDHDSGAWEEFLQGRKNWSVEAPCRYDEADAGQDTAIQAAFDGTQVKVRFRMKGAGAGNKQLIGDAFVRAVPMNAPNDEAADLGLTFRGTGALARSTQ